MGAPQYPGTQPYQPYPQYGVAAPSLEKPTAAFVLALIGGIFMILWGVALFAIAGFIGRLGLGAIGAGLNTLAALQLVFGFVLIVLGVILYTQPEHHVALGIGILVVSVLSLLEGGGGLIIGFILGLIGGILGIVWKPSQVFVQPVYMAPSSMMGGPPQGFPYSAPPTRVCTKCGRSAGPELKFCPNCGNQLA